MLKGLRQRPAAGQGLRPQVRMEHVCVYVWMCGCVDVCMCVCVYVCMCVCGVVAGSADGPDP